MSRKLITILSSFAVVASLTLSPAYAQSHGGGHVVTPQVKSTPHADDHSPKTPLTVAQRIDAHPDLVTRLTPLLPSGMTLDQAAAGFKTQGQFIAALHVSKNLNIPFDKLKADMTTGDHDSLGQAIKDLAPTADAKSAVKLAEKEARADLEASEKPRTLTVAQRIDAHPDLVARLTPLLPSGMTLDQAAAGFKNQGQFIAALHASKDLNIPFDKLKADMTTGDHDSLGQAIKDLAPTANAKTAVEQAEKEARADLNATETVKKTNADKDDK